MMESKICGGESESSEVVEVPDDDDDATGQRSKDVGGHLRDQHSSDSGDDPKSRSNSSSQMIGLLSEFTKIYSDRLQRVEQSAMKSGDHQYLESKVCVLESWVRDLGEQNEVLVATVEELEKEAADRVALLEDRLAKMATTTRESCVSLRDHQLQVSTLVADKIGLERETQGMGDKLVNLELKNQRLKEENCNLQSDLNNLVQVISRARSTGQWVADDLTFSCVTPEQVFGPVLSSSRRSSQSLKDSQRDYINQMLEDQIKLGSSSTSSLSHFQEVEGSLYSGCGSDKDMLIMKLKGDLRYSQMAYEDVTCQLVERDKQIADLQARLTEIHHELAESQAEVSQSTRTLQELRHQNRHDSAEVTRKEEMIRNLLCKASKKDPLKCSLTSLCELDSAISESNMELQLNENIDILVSRLAELEDECQNLRDQVSTLQDSHSLCSPKINILQEKLSRSQQTQVELRTVLTAEVAERHDQVVSLKDQLKEQEQNHHDTQMQLQLRNEVIKDLRREVKEMKEKSIESPVEEEFEEFDNCNVGTMSNETQTYQIDNSDKGVMTEPSSFSPPNGLYVSTTPHVSQVSKLQNELAEKSILLRELQSHLASSRQELNLKDETLSKLEQKLNTTRQEDGQKEERMHYLTGQLTSLQLEVGRTHGQAVQLRRQVDNKSEMLQKMESENSSLTKMLNEKSSTLEKYQSDILKISSDLDRKKKEVTDQRLTINSLQDALVSSKRTCDSLRMRLDSDVSDGMLHYSLPPQILASSNNAQSISAGVTKSTFISSSDLASQSHGRESLGVCMDSTNGHVLPSNPLNLESANNHILEMPSNDTKRCHMNSSLPLDFNDLSDPMNKLANLRTTCSESCANNNLNHASYTVNANRPMSLNGSSGFMPNPSLHQVNLDDGTIQHGTHKAMNQVVQESAIRVCQERVNGECAPGFSGQVYDV